MRDETLILGLHRIGRPGREAVLRGLFTSEGVLRFQVRLLRALGFEFATLRDAMSRRSGRTAVITFDDGYADNVAALSVLRDLGVPATIFVITGDVGMRNVVWDEAGDKTPADMLSWPDLETMSRDGWEIAGHADEHVHLAERPLHEQRSTVARCLSTISRRLGASVVSFAYPYGSYSEGTKEILRDLGIRFAVTTRKPGVGDLAADSDLELKRLSVGGWSWHHYLRIVLRTFGVLGFSGLAGAVLPARILLSPVPLAVEDQFGSQTST